VTDSTLVAFPGLAVTIGDVPERLGALEVTADFFPLLGVVPAAGVAFTREAEQAGKRDVLLISYRLWERRFTGA
jgi:hypothetical protein